MQHAVSRNSSDKWTTQSTLALIYTLHTVLLLHSWSHSLPKVLLPFCTVTLTTQSTLTPLYSHTHYPKYSYSTVVTLTTQSTLNPLYCHTHYPKYSHSTVQSHSLLKVLLLHHTVTLTTQSTLTPLYGHTHYTKYSYPTVQSHSLHKVLLLYCTVTFTIHSK